MANPSLSLKEVFTIRLLHKAGFPLRAISDGARPLSLSGELTESVQQLNDAYQDSAFSIATPSRVLVNAAHKIHDVFLGIKAGVADEFLDEIGYELRKDPQTTKFYGPVPHGQAELAVYIDALFKTAVDAGVRLNSELAMHPDYVDIIVELPAFDR